MADKKQPARDNFVAKIVKDPKQVPDTLLLTGYLGDSSEANYTRLYFDPQLTQFVEIPDDAILHTQDQPGADPGLGATYVWIKRDAVLIHSKAASTQTRAKFLDGPIAREYARAQAPVAGGGGQGGQWPDDGGIDNTVAFCPISFGGIDCGYTSVPLICNLGQPTTPQLCPTQTFGCPTAFPCPRPTVLHNCPTSNAPRLCHTVICVVKPVEQANQPAAAHAAAQAQAAGQFAQPLGVTLPACLAPTHTAGCTASVLHACVSVTPACSPSIHNVCVSVTPACHPSVFVYCATQVAVCGVHTLVGCPVNTIVGCPIPTGNCPSIGGCPSIACTPGFGGSPIQ